MVIVILLLIQLLTHLGLKVPQAFSYASTRMVLATITTLGLTILLGRGFIKKLYELKIGHTIRVADVAVLAGQYTKSRDVPSMGGILFITTILISALLWMDLSQPFSLLLLLSMLWMGFIGGMDDYFKMKNKKGIRPRLKMVLQLALGSFLSLYLFCSPIAEAPAAKIKVENEMKTLSSKQYASLYFIPCFKKPMVLKGAAIAIAFILTLFVISGTANAVNLADGLDGLATGLVLLVALVLAIFAFVSNHLGIASYLNILYIEGSGEIATFLCATMGACLGFLWYNGYPAQVFMGDTGSLALGGILGVSAVLLRRELILALVGGVLVMETLSVILQVMSFRLRKGKRIFLCAPLHHHFEMKGWHEAKIVTRFWMIGLLLALIGLATLKMQ